MELWMKYALVAAVFIAVRDIFSNKIHSYKFSNNYLFS